MASVQYVKMLAAILATAAATEVLHPLSVANITGAVNNASSLCGDTQGSALFLDAGSATYDFAGSIAGGIEIFVGDIDRYQYIGVACCANAAAAQWSFAPGPGNYTASCANASQSCNSLVLLHNTTGGIEVRQISVNVG